MPILIINKYDSDFVCKFDKNVWFLNQSWVLTSYIYFVTFIWVNWLGNILLKYI